MNSGFITERVLSVEGCLQQALFEIYPKEKWHVEEQTSRESTKQNRERITKGRRRFVLFCVWTGREREREREIEREIEKEAFRKETVCR